MTVESVAAAVAVGHVERVLPAVVTLAGVGIVGRVVDDEIDVGYAVDAEVASGGVRGDESHGEGYRVGDVGSQRAKRSA